MSEAGPQCNQPLGRFARRCPFCGWARGSAHDLVAEAGQLAQQAADLDSETLHAEATTLHERLKQLVA
jgi:hypothetical protein